GAQQVLIRLDRNGQSSFAARAAWEQDASHCLGKPRLPGYTEQPKGRKLLVSTLQALSAPALREGVIAPSRLAITVQTRHQEVQQVRRIHRSAGSVGEVSYEREPIPAPVTPALQAGGDSGLNHLAALTSDKPGVVPRVVNGRPVKAINQFSNTQRAELQS